jgi:hypothetical protein
MSPLPFTTFDPAFALCASVETSFGPLIFYGSIITYHFDGVRQGRAPWELHQESCMRHGRDWAQIKQSFPDHGLVAGGDWNQALDRVGRYRNSKSLELIGAALAGAGLTPLTAEDFVANGKLRGRHSVDHIAATLRRPTMEIADVHAFEGEFAGVTLSDHNGVVVTLRVKT